MLAQLAVATSLVVLAPTVRLGAFFALTVMAGFHRACFYFVPFAVTNDIVQSMVSAVVLATHTDSSSSWLVS